MIQTIAFYPACEYNLQESKLLFSRVAALQFIKEVYHLPEQNKPKMTLDCVGLYCPEPLYQTRKNLDALEVGEVLEVLADDPTAAEDITRFAKRSGHEVVEFENKDGQLRFLIKKGK